MAPGDWIWEVWSLVYRIESAGAIVLSIVTAVLLASSRVVRERLLLAFRKFRHPGWEDCSQERLDFCNSCLKLYNDDETFQGQCEFVRVLREQPELQPGEWWFDVESVDDSKYSQELAERKYDNEHIAVFHDSRKTDWDLSPPNISYQTIRYSELRALMESGERPVSISCGALLVCNESGRMLLHERARYLHSNPGKRHTFGGRVRGERGASDKSDSDCWEAMTREVREETGIGLGDEIGKHPVYVGRQFGGKEGFEWLQIYFLGVPVTQRQLEEAIKKNKKHWEGKVTSLGFDRLDAWFDEPESYVSSGLLQILCWLEMDAPGLDRKWRKLVKRWKRRRARKGSGGVFAGTWRDIEGLKGN